MTNPQTTWPHEIAPAQLAFVGDDIYVSSLRGYQLWHIPVDVDSARIGEKTAVHGGRALRAIAKVPGHNELWLSSTATNGGDEIYRVTVG